EPLQRPTTRRQMSMTDTPQPVNTRRRHVMVSLAIAGAAAVLIGLLSYGLMIDPTKVPPANIGKDAEPFRVSWVQGETLIQTKENGFVSLADLKGKPVVLNFWASWCVSCRQEAHELEKFWRANKDKVVVLGVAIQDTKEEAKKFADYFGK